ncbi:plasmid recombination protein [Jutongia sp.]
MTMKRTISGMIGAGSLAHNRRDFIAGNVDLDRVHLNICYQNENLKQVYKELFDESVERYNVGKRKDRQITNYYEKIRQGKQEKLFHEVIFQIGNCEDMATGSPNGELAVKVLDEYIQDFQKRNPTLRVFSCYLHQDEATPHLHIDFVPYVTGWKGKGMDTRVSLKQALKSLGFQGGNKHDTELNQWMNHEKEVLAEIAKHHGIEWEQKGTHEEHLDVYNFKKKERKKEVQELEQEKEYLTAENEGLTAQIAEVRADIKMLEEEKNQAQKDKEMAEQRAEKAEKELKSLEQHREQLQPIMDNVNKELREVGTIELLLPEAGSLERAATYRDKKIKPLFIKMKNKIAAMAAQVKELTGQVETWKRKYQKEKQKCEGMKIELQELRRDNNCLSEKNEKLLNISTRYDRVVRVLGITTVDAAVQKDIQIQQELEEILRKEQMPRKMSDRLQWARERSQEHNTQSRKSKTKYRGMEI